MSKVDPIDEEYHFEGRAIISETDADGNIIYANRKFCEISGYEKSELLGQPHNIIRHPDVPISIFENMWTTIKQGRIWNGILKNLRKDGRYYWVDTTITPVTDEHGIIKGYAATRKPASQVAIDEAQKEYSRLRSEAS